MGILLLRVSFLSYALTTSKENWVADVLEKVNEGALDSMFLKTSP